LPDKGLRCFVKKLLERGFSGEKTSIMIVNNPSSLIQYIPLDRCRRAISFIGNDNVALKEFQEGKRYVRDWKAIGESKDLWSGLFFFITGIIFVGLSRNYQMGVAMKIGPAYFPTLLGSLLALIGLALMARAFIRPGPSVGHLAYSKIAWVVIANVLFAVSLRRLGLAVALILLVILSAYASKRFRWPAALCLAAGLSLGAVIVFIWLLKLPIPILGTWFGG
jgi:hypothetical protein